MSGSLEIQRDERPAVYFEDDVMIVRASALGMCIKGLVAAKMGLEPLPVSENLQKAFDAGIKYEDAIIRKAFGDVSGAQEEINLIVSGGCKVRGHLDFLSEKFVGEVKLLGEDSFVKIAGQGVDALPEYYKWQVSCYMVATNLPCRFVIGKKVNNEWNGEFLDLLIEKPFYSFSDISKRVSMIKRSDFLPLCDYVNFPCRWVHLHTDQDVNKINESVEIEEKDSGVFLNLIDKLNRAKEKIKEGEAEKSSAYEGLKGLVEEYGANRLRSGNLKMTWVRQIKRTIDWEKVPEEMKEALEEFKTKEVVSEYPRIFDAENK